NPTVRTHNRDMHPRNTVRATIKAVAGLCTVLALGACATRDHADAPPSLPLTPGTIGTVTTVSGFEPLREEDVTVFARQSLGDSAVLDDAEKAQAAAAANDAVSAAAGARIEWRSAQHSGYAEAVGTRYQKFVWHCHDTGR